MDGFNEHKQDINIHIKSAALLIKINCCQAHSRQMASWKFSCLYMKDTWVTELILALKIIELDTHYFWNSDFFWRNY